MPGLMTDYLSAQTGAPAGAPDLVTGEWGFNQDDANGNLRAWDLSSAAWAALSVISLEYPTRASVWGDAATVTVGGTLGTNHDANQNYCTISFQNTPANGDTFTLSFWLADGTYTLYKLGSTYSAHGKQDTYIDGVLQGAGGQDWYAAGTNYNQVKSESVTVVGSGKHTLRITINGKNASSSGYGWGITKMWFQPSAD